MNVPDRLETLVSEARAAHVDLNADLGESFGSWVLGDDDAMLELVTSANVACGFHAGDPTTLRRTCARAVERGVVVGAQVGYRDLAGFGRRFIEVAPDDLEADVLYQIGALDGLARVAGDRVRYVKPHGALYNAVVHHEEQAAAVVAAVRAYDPGLPLLGLPGSAVLRLAAEAGLTVVPEAFADRAYTARGTLVGRREPGAVLHDPREVADRVVRMVTTGEVEAVDGSTVRLGAATVCLHGDTRGAVAMARAVREALARAGVDVSPFVATAA
jgi:5-oxoprolinase (ATP-hydrolysing) subunit A